MTKHYIEVRTKRKDWRVTSTFGFTSSEAAQREIDSLKDTQDDIRYRVLTLTTPTPQQRAQ